MSGRKRPTRLDQMVGAGIEGVEAIEEKAIASTRRTVRPDPRQMVRHSNRKDGT
jgi:hypothetical protein